MDGDDMITVTGLRNFLWSALAFLIVVCAATPLDRRAAEDSPVGDQQLREAAVAERQASWQDTGI